MAKKLYDAAVKTGSYQDTTGTQRNRYENIGAVMEGDNGPYLMLKRTFNPAGVPGSQDRDSLIVSLFKPKSVAEFQASAHSKAEDDDIPF